MKCLIGWLPPAPFWWSGCAGGHGQALEQVPSDAVACLRSKTFRGLSTKVAKFAKTLGSTNSIRVGPTRCSLQDEFDLKQGVNKNGDLAIAFFDKPDKKDAKANSPAGEGGEPPVIVILATDDYKAFLGNFSDVKDEGNDISQVTVKKNHEKLFVTQRGKYAVAAMDKLLLTDHKAGGFKLEGAAAKEAQTKDAIFYVDMKTLRPRIQDGMKQAHDAIDQQFKQPKAGAGNPFAAQMTPQMRKMFDAYFSAGDQIVKDARSGTFSSI